MLIGALRKKLGAYEDSKARQVPSGRLWPNGEFTVGFTALGEETNIKAELDYTTPERWMSPDELDERLTAMHELLDEVQRFYSMHADLAGSGLTLSNVWNSDTPTPRTKNGLKGLTGYGTKMLRSACYLLEERLGKDDCCMVTITVPALSQADRVKVAKAWPVLTNRLVKWLTLALLRAGRTPVIAGCVEVQTGRLKKYAQGYLHLHLVCPAHSNKGGTWAVQAGKLRAWWKGALEGVIGKELPHLPRVETAIVEKSVEGYLGKYLSKGQGDELEAFVADLGEECVPGQWWFMSAPMRDAVKNDTRAGKNTGAILNDLVNHLLEQGTGEGFEYIRHVDRQIGLHKVTIGYVGRLSPGLAEEVRAILECGLA